MDLTIDQVLEEYKDLVRVKAGLYFMLGSEKEDLIQEGMIGLVRAYNSFDESKGASFKTYADLCVNRQMINAIKSAGKQKNAALNTAVSLETPVVEGDGLTIAETLVGGYEQSPEDQVVFEELMGIIKDSDSKYFTEMEHSVLNLLLEGLRYKEIAERLGKTPKQIDNCIQRIKNKVKALL